MKKRKKISPVRILFYLILISYSVITLGPFLWSIIISLKPSSDTNALSVDFSTLSFKTISLYLKTSPLQGGCLIVFSLH